MAKNGDGEFAFFICQIRHFAIGPPPRPNYGKEGTFCLFVSPSSILELKYHYRLWYPDLHFILLMEGAESLGSSRFILLHMDTVYINYDSVYIRLKYGQFIHLFFGDPYIYPDI